MHSLQAFESMPVSTQYLPEGKEHSNIHAERLDRLGHILTKPASLWLKGFARVFLLSFKAGWWGQKSHPATEVLYRASLVIVGLIGIPFATLGSLLGGSMRALSSFSKRDFVIHQLPVSASKYQKGNKELKVLSYNTQLMPEMVVTLNRQRPTMERVHEIAEGIIQSNADIVCLQEVFHTEAAEILDQKLHANGYNLIRNVGHQVLGINSGLFIASKYPLENVQFIKHPPLQDGIDKFASKGLLLATANVNGKKVVIANTHFSDAGTKDLPNYVIRVGQSLAITARIDKYVKDMMSKGFNVEGVIFNGDANIGPTVLEQDDSKRTLNPPLDPEWHLTNRIYRELTGLIPQPKDFENHKAWTLFKNKVKDVYKKLATEIHTMDPLEFVRTGGPLPTSLYTHDLHNATKYENAIKGSLIDLSADPELGWGKKTDTYPIRLDFIMTRKAFTHNGHCLAEPKLQGLEIGPMLSKEGRLTSDHSAVTAQFTIPDSGCTKI